MLTNDLAQILERDLTKLREEIRSYGNEEDLWMVAPGISNSAGTLALHLAGNLQHYIGAVLGGNGYRRDREAEFTRRNVSHDELLAGLDQAARVIREVLPSLRDEDLSREYPEEVGGRRMTTRFFLIHLSGHLAYHLGQVNYHRRLLTPQHREQPLRARIPN